MFLDAILSTETIAGILIIGALVMAVRSILFFTREAAAMAPRLQKIDMDLNKRREGMSEKKKAVKDLTVIVDPLKNSEGKLRAYYEVLQNIEISHERTEAEQGEKEEKERSKRIQRKKMGFD
ncbi:MAG: hypothetical protein HN559_12620 [Gemmatimonadetes bacterium]|jgi:hypothetical protein|nr:hypothetical protein [Gemmatimonadota bacterium]